MKLNKHALKWMLYKRFCMKRRVEGFHAHWNTVVSDDSTFGEYVHLFDGAKVGSASIGRFSKIIGASVTKAKIGAFSSIAQRSRIGGGGDHPLDQVSHHSIFYSNSLHQHPNLLLTQVNKYPGDMKETIIGNDVWVGSDAIIKHGIEIGDGAVIATGAVVVKDVPAYAIVGGVSAKIIRYRHEPELISALQEVQWWNWSIEALQVISNAFDKDQPLTLKKLDEIKRKAILTV